MRLLTMGVFILQIMMISNADCTNITDAAIWIASTEFDPHQITIVMWVSEDNVDVTEILIKYSGLVVTAPIHNHTVPVHSQLFFTQRVTQTIFVASTVEHFERMAKITKIDTVLPLQAILILTEPIEYDSQITDATKAAWVNDIGDIVVLSTEGGEENVFYWTYFPYGNGDCRNYTAVPLDITGGTYFPRKFSNFFGCPVRLSLFHFLPHLIVETDNDTVVSISGTDGMLLNLIKEKLNATFDIVRVRYQGAVGTFINGSGTGAFADIVSGIVDIVAPAVMITYFRYPRSQISNTYRSIEVYWCGPNQREIYTWAKVLLPFFSSISPFIVLSFVIFIIVTKFIRRYDLCKPKRKRGVFFMTFVMFLGQEVKFETKSWLVNSMFVLWLWFCMVVRIAYQADLLEGLHKKILEPPLGTINEAVEKVDGYGGMQAFIHIFKNTSLEDNFKYIPANEAYMYLEKIAGGKRFMLAVDITFAEWSQKPLQILEKPLTRGAACLHMRMGWPAGPKVKSITIAITEAGLIRKIDEDIKHDLKLKNAGDRSETEETQTLDMATLGACFLGLLFMYAVCFIIFCGEVICHKYELKSKLKRKFKVK